MPLTAGGLRAQVSRAAPPPLPGGYKVGDQVFFTGPSQTTLNGDKLVHGRQGEVTGPGTGKWTEGVKVLFPCNEGSINCYLTNVRRPRAAPAAHPARIRSATVSMLHRDHASSWAAVRRAICLVMPW